MPALSEDLMRQMWARNIKPSDRAQQSMSKNIGKDHARLTFQAAYAAACTPRLEGDSTLIALWGQGHTIAEICNESGLGEVRVRDRIVACHPDQAPMRPKR